MSKQISFFIENPDTSSKQKIEAIFDDAELNMLEGYLLQIEDLRKTKLIKHGFHPSLNLKWEKDIGFTVETELPPEDDLLALLHRLRPFILKQEFASFEKVASLLRKKFNHNDFQPFLKYYRHLYQGKQIESVMTIRSNDLIVNSEKTMMDWLNAYEYHRDQDKKLKLKPIFEMFTHDGARAIFVMFVVDKIKAILGISDLVKLALGKDEVNSIYFNPTPKCTT